MDWQIESHDAMAQLDTLLDAVERGERVVITRAGQPVATLAPYARVLPPKNVLGLDIEIPDDFDEPLDALFEALATRN